MRWSDAAVVDLAHFHARRPVLGNLLRWLGYAGLAAVWGFASCGSRPGVWLCFGALLLLWLVAWRLELGAAWRASVVAGMLLAVLELGLGGLS